MIAPEPSTLGAGLFRPVVAGTAWRTAVANLFRPMVAGQYLRMNQEIDSTELTFLTTGTGIRSDYRVTVNVNPQLIWQLMNHPPPTVHGNSTINHPTNASRSISKVAEWLRTSQHFQISSTATQKRPEAGAERETERRHKAPTGFAPVTLLFHRRPVEKGSDGLESRSIENHSKHTFAHIFEHRRDHTERQSDPGQPRSTDQRASLEAHWENREGLSLPLVQQATKRLATDSASSEKKPIGGASAAGTPTRAGESSGVRTLLTSSVRFGGVASVGVQQPTPLIPTVYRAGSDHNSGHNTAFYRNGDIYEQNVDNLLNGTSVGNTFSKDVSVRHTRVENSPASASTTSIVSTVFRVPPSPPTSPPSNEIADIRFQSSTGPANSSAGSATLSPDLMHRLTEQVVRAIDARALAARERAGRF